MRTDRTYREIEARQLLGGDRLLCPDGPKRVVRVQYIGTADRIDKVAVELVSGWTEFLPGEPLWIE